MNQSFTFWSFLIPIIIFAFALYIGVVPNTQNLKTSTKRIVFCGIGIAFGLFTTIKALSTSGNMNAGEATEFIYGITILGWSVYAYYTHHSQLPLSRKIIKAIIYWIITGCLLGTTSSVVHVRTWSCAMMFVLPIIAYYSGVIDKDHKEQSISKISDHKTDSKSNRIGCKSVLKSCTSFLHSLKTWIYDWWNNNLSNFQRKIAKIVIGVIVFLVVLPFLTKLYDTYMDYFYEYSGHKREVQKEIHHYYHKKRGIGN